LEEEQEEEMQEQWGEEECRKAQSLARFETTD